MGPFNFSSRRSGESSWFWLVWGGCVFITGVCVFGWEGVSGIVVGSCRSFRGLVNRRVKISSCLRISRRHVGLFTSTALSRR